MRLTHRVSHGNTAAHLSHKHVALRGHFVPKKVRLGARTVLTILHLRTNVRIIC